MAVDERKRHELHTELAGMLGADKAATLMELLPGAGWADVATKQDLDALAATVRRDMATKEDLQRMGRLLVMWTSSMVLASGGLAFLVGRLV